jgi:hypothetical protein
MPVLVILFIIEIAALKNTSYTVKQNFVAFFVFVVIGDTIEKVSKSSILTKVSILSILAKSIGNSIPLEPAKFFVSIPDQPLNTS